MVRRGQMTQDEADRLIREAEEAQGKRGPRPSGVKPVAERSSAKGDRTRDAAARVETKPAPSTAKPAAGGAKRISGSTAAPRAEPKAEKKEQAKRTVAPKKTAKPSPPKKRR
jgi:hypothetical protein